MQALPAQPESLCIVEMGGVEKQDELGEKGSIGFLYLNIGLQVVSLFYIHDSKILLGFFRAEVMSHRCVAFGSHHLNAMFALSCFSEWCTSTDCTGPGDRRPVRYQNPLPWFPTCQALQSQDAGTGSSMSLSLTYSQFS